jgi:hypothetical protein
MDAVKHKVSPLGLRGHSRLERGAKIMKYDRTNQTAGDCIIALERTCMLRREQGQSPECSGCLRHGPQQSLGVTGLLDLVHPPEFSVLQNTTFRKLDLFPCKISRFHGGDYEERRLL